MLPSRRSTLATNCQLMAGLVLACTFLCQQSADAQTSYTLIHRFYSGARAPIGRLVEAADGSLFGTTFCGGEPGAGCHGGGTIFALRRQSDGTWRFENLHHLRPGLTGGNPSGGLTLTRDGNFYGIATTRGLPGPHLSTAAIFRLTASGALSAVHVFPGDQIGISGEDPIGRLMEASDGNLYGATCRESRFNIFSTIFRLTPTGSFATIHQFRNRDPANPSQFNPVDGLCPMTELTEMPDGFLYGTAVAGGRFHPLFPELPRFGTLFRVDPRIVPSPLTVLHTFYGLDGAGPTGALIPGSSGDFFGTTASGGLFGQGVVYRRAASGAISNVHTFFGLDGSTPFGSLLRAADGALYGTTLRGGLFGHGALFRISGSAFSPVHWFSGADGSAPVEVMQARDGNLYGAATSGGPGGGGTIYQVRPDGTLNTVHAFAGQPRGPQGPVVQDADGNLYGTVAGSSVGAGGVFKLTPAGRLTMIHEFAGTPRPGFTDATNSTGGLIDGGDGFLYGRTHWGGTYDSGTLYRITTTGTFASLHSFTSPGVDPLIVGTDGNIYGNTGGDSATAPTIFQVDRAGRVSTLYDFAGSGVSSVVGPIAEGPDGALYGVAFGTLFNGGGLFKVTKTGVFRALSGFEFNSAIGSGPRFGLIRSSDGGLYGAATQAAFNPPAIFRFDPQTETIVAVAPIVDIVLSLMEGRDGAIYGVTGNPSGSRPPGKIIRLAGGQLEYLYNMTDADGLRTSSLIQGSDGALYGTVSEGPSNEQMPETWAPDVFAGGVFRLIVPAVASSAAAVRK